MGKQRLGTNLNALLSSARQKSAILEERMEHAAVATVDKDKNLKNLPVEYLSRGKYQPRRDMHPDALEELAESIREQGVIQPIVVRKKANNQYEIIAGERRWRAAQLAGLAEIPALIRDVEDDAAISMALIENIQREDLNPIEEAMALMRLQQEFELTQQEVAKAVGKSRAAVANLLRLMSLGEEIQKMLEYGDLEMGHARALISLDEQNQLSVAKTIVAKGLSVRQTESLVRHLQKEKKDKKGDRPDPNIRQLEDDLAERIGAKVAIQCNAKGKGKLVISYNSLDELDGVLAHIK